MNDLRKAAEMALEALECAYKGKDRTGQVIDAIVALEKALDDKPPVKTYAGGKPNYCTPQPEVCCGEYARCLKVCIPKERWFAQQKLNVDAVNMTPDRVDETAKGEHEPVAWMYDWYDETEDIDGVPIGGIVSDCISKDYDEAHSPTMGCHNIRPLYTAPPQREWVGLTDEEYEAIREDGQFGKGSIRFKNLFEAIEAKLKEKNT